MTVERVALDGVVNLRDLGGTRLRPGLVFRSATLHRLSPAGQEALVALGVGTVVDLRAVAEVESQGGDLLPAGVALFPSPVGGGSVADWAARLPGLDTPAKTEAFVEGLYRGYVTDPASRASYAAVLRHLADTEAPVLLHCTAGKDRTGFATAILLEVLGVPRAEVYADYLLSRAALGELSDELTQVFVDLGLDPRALAPLLDVRESYLDAAYTQIEADYGSFDGFVAEGLGIEGAVVDRLRARLLA